MIDYSVYKYKIIELERQDWEGLHFTLHFVSDLNDNCRKQIESEIERWFKIGQEVPDGGLHYLEDFTWPDKTLKWRIDFGSAENDALISLLNLLSKWTETITLLEIGDIGQNAFVNKRKFWYKVTTFPGVDPTKCLFKVTQLENNDSDWGLTLYLKETVSSKTKKEIEDSINNWFQKKKESLNTQDPWFDPWIGGFAWKDDKILGWWVGGRSDKPEMFNLLFKDLSKFSEQIDELIIGGRFPKREKIDYRSTTT